MTNGGLMGKISKFKFTSVNNLTIFRVLKAYEVKKLVQQMEAKSIIALKLVTVVKNTQLLYTP